MTQSSPAELQRSHDSPLLQIPSRSRRNYTTTINPAPIRMSPRPVIELNPVHRIQTRGNKPAEPKPKSKERRRWQTNGTNTRTVIEWPGVAAPIDLVPPSPVVTAPLHQLPSTLFTASPQSSSLLPAFEPDKRGSLPDFHRPPEFLTGATETHPVTSFKSAAKSRSVHVFENTRQNVPCSIHTQQLGEWHVPQQQQPIRKGSKPETIVSPQSPPNDHSS
ncbi:hypothetical protein BLNAU_1599 [Blattamonas nauphoetae]|uniref:Uncharacterized protein n=1 Tax=Blattamonas nauphoetae TaxID=2049346 RepID=A0ABQ9YIH2_9EUKA|nr:hypothetical protein BLNAU_1599 [Blattamonas nauphoetae]